MQYHGNFLSTQYDGVRICLLYSNHFSEIIQFLLRNYPSIAKPTTIRGYSCYSWQFFSSSLIVVRVALVNRPYVH